MNSIEQLMSEYPQLNYIYTRMPEGLPGLIIDKTVYLKKDLTYQKEHETLAEEIGHYKTSVGDLTSLDNAVNRKQEKIARDWGRMKIITLDGLISCYKLCMRTAQEVADYFDVSVKYLFEALEMYKRKFGVIYSYRGYTFIFDRGLILNKESETIEN
ncbi:hypothetical protein [Ligilactobacillus equi]|uniref:IrrE N-terminal-like domain-containing protein n=1 Tax=Ligilactobacillus equi DSM 15833 = JCM 10991 TaxID=1423740 RepID=A0A0R1TDA3_9LACO|nr:hypothetical protein [Ligilactobacillus equi]KRL76643.1 hypothetical protein FC36_GL001886 [Ligilactobacillus equi DSM 15833 = JCM 10991]